MAALIVPAWFATPASAQVSSTSTVDSVDDVGMYSSIAVDSNGFVHMVYFNATSHTLKYANNSLGYWSVETVASETGYWKGEYCSIALDSYDHPHISYLIYEEATGDAWVGYRNKTADWSVETWIGKDAGHYHGYCTDIAIDPSNNVHIVYGNSDGESVHPFYATNVGGSFSVEIIQSSDYSYGGGYNSIAIGPDGVPKVATWGTQTEHGPVMPNPSAPGEDPNLGLWYAVRSETNWSYTQVEAGDVGVGAQIAVDSINRAHISYESNATQYIRYAHQEVAGGAFTLENVTSNGGDAYGGYTGIAVDSEKQVFISYQRVHGSGPLTHCHIEVAAYRNNGWTFDEVDQGSVFYSSFQTSIATDSDAGAHLAYYDSINNDAKYAKLSYVPMAPGEFQATGGSGKVTLTWLAPALNGGSAITGCKIYRGTSSGGETLYHTIGIVALSYNDTSVSWGVTYYYKISAVNAVGESLLTGEDSATPTATVPGQPGDLLGTPGNTQVTLTWSAAADHGSVVTSYKVYRSLTSGAEALRATLGNVLTYADTSLTNGQTYYYKVSAVNAVGEGVLSSEVGPVMPRSTPGIPTGLAATPGDALVVLDWAAPLDDGGQAIINYKVYRGTSSGAETYLTTVGNVLTFTDTGRTNGVTYFYKVSAVNSVGEGASSYEVSATPSTVPTAPTLTSATPGNAQVVLAWVAPSSDGGASITNYKMYRGTTSGGETLLTTVGSVLTYIDTSLTNGQTYYYKVSAVNSVGEGVQSNELNATPATVPSAPTMGSATPGDTQVNLTWSAPANDGGASITNYRVYRSTTSGGETLLATGGNVLTYTDTSLTNGQIYYYKVSAVNSVGEGAQSDEASATPATVPSAPTIDSATPGDTQVVLVWSAPVDNGGASVTNYRVYRGTTSGGEAFLTSLGNFLTYTDTLLINGQTYYYEISAVNSIGEGAQSNELNANPIGPPTAPQDLQASPGDAFINLTWQAPSNEGGSAVTDYQVWRGAISGAETFFVNAGLRLWFNDTGLTNGQTYYYMVRAENAQSAGPNSSEASATPRLTVTVPSAPQNLQATPGLFQVNLTWSAPANDGGAPITNYRVYRGTSLGGETLLTTLGSVLAYTDTGLANHQTYWYKVSAMNSAGEGTLCSAVSATPSYDFDYRLINGDTEVEITGYHGPGGIVSIPGMIDGKPVTSIGDHAFDSCISLISMTIPIGVTSIGDSAFYYCTSLTSVTIPNGVASIGDSSFYYCNSLTSVTIPSSVISIGSYAFATCTNLTSVTIGSSSTSIEERSFKDGVSLSVDIPSSTTSIGDYAFSYCTALTSVTMGSGVASIGNYTFYCCTALTSVTMGSDVTSIGDGAFYNCTSLTSVIVPIGVTSIGNYAFAVCTSLTSVTIGSNVTSIGNGTFYSCTSLLSITFLVLDAPTDVGEDWILGTDAAIRGHAYATSNFPAPGGVWNGLMMGAVIPMAPGAPTNLTAAPGNTSVTLTWTTPASDGGSPITGYKLYRSTTSGGTYSLIASPSALTYTDTGLTNGQTYWYKVSAVNAIGVGTNCSAVSALVSQPVSPAGDMTMLILAAVLAIALVLVAVLLYMRKKK